MSDGVYSEVKREIMLYVLLIQLALAARESGTDLGYYEQTLHARLFGSEGFVVDDNGTATLQKFPKTYNRNAHPIDLGNVPYYNDTYWNNNQSAFVEVICEEYETWVATYIFGDEDADVSHYVSRELGGECYPWLDGQLTPDLDKYSGSFVAAYYGNYDTKYSTVAVEEYPGRMIEALKVDIIVQLQGVNESESSFL